MQRPPIRVRLVLPALAAAAALVVAVNEVVHLWFSRSFRRSVDPDRSCGVIALGCRSRPDGTLSPMQAWRVDVAARTLARAGSGVIVCTGGATRPGSASEAAVMTSYAVDDLGIASDRVLVEWQARDTWENVAFSAPLVAGYDTIALASNPVHAARARRLLGALYPELTPKLVRADDYRFLEHPWIKLGCTVYEAMIVCWRLTGSPGRVHGECSSPVGSSA